MFFLEDPVSHIEVSKETDTISLSLISPFIRPMEPPISGIQVVDWFQRAISAFFLSFFCPFLPQPQVIFSELHVQLSSQGRHGDFSFQTEFAHIRDLDPFFLSTRIFHHLKMTQYLALVSRSFSENLSFARDLSNLMMLAAACCRLLPRTRDTEWVSTCFALLIEQWGTQLSDISRSGFRCGNCGCEVVVVGVEAVSPRGDVDRRVLTAYFNAGLGLITCKRPLFDQAAKQHAFARSSAGVRPIPVFGSGVCVGGGVEHKE